MNDRKKALTLKRELDYYLLQDPRWRRNFRRRVQRLAGNYDPRVTKTLDGADADVGVIMILDHIAFKLDLELSYGNLERV